MPFYKYRYVQMSEIKYFVSKNYFSLIETKEEKLDKESVLCHGCLGLEHLPAGRA